MLSRFKQITGCFVSGLRVPSCHLMPLFLLMQRYIGNRIVRSHGFGGVFCCTLPFNGNPA